MSSTINTSIISTIMTAIASSMSIVAVVLLVALLIQKELTNGSGSGRSKKLSQVLNIGIVPLLLVFIFILVLKAIEILQ